MDLIADLETEKRACLIRLRHMEAYCHGTTYPLPAESHSDGSPVEAQRPARKVTDRDFHNLATQYRERDAMNSLHRSKIEVLRGRQEKIYQNFVARKEQEAVDLVKLNQKKYAGYCDKCAAEESIMEMAFGEKKVRTQERWKLREQLERRKLEKITWQTPEPLPKLAHASAVT